MNIYWLIHSIAYWSLTIFFVPFKYFKKLILFAFLGGFVYTWAVQYTAINVFKFWSYKPTFFTVFNIPFFFVISWFGATLLYGYLLINYHNYQVYIILFYIVWTTVDNYFGKSTGIFIMNNWNIFLTFLFAIISHIFLLYLLKYINKVDEIGTKRDLLNLKKQ